MLVAQPYRLPPCSLCFTKAVYLLCTIAIASSNVRASPLAGKSWPSMPLVHRTPEHRSPLEWGTWAKTQKEALEAKYGIDRTYRKRASGSSSLSNQNADSSYFGSIAVGTPPVLFNVMLDTGSSDLWLVTDAARSTIPAETPAFNPSVSTTFMPINMTFSIQYGSGAASGVLGRDNVQFAGFEVSDQVFGIASNVTNGLLKEPVSGLLGLAFQDIATPGTTPLWQSLVASPGTLDAPLMAFQLTRFVNTSGVQSVEFGGTFTIGATDASLFTGEIEFVDVPPGEVGFWSIPLRLVTVQGMSLNTSASGTSLAAIDTGTTLIGGPSEFIQEVFSTIPGSMPGTGDWEGYYTYPCDTEVNVALSFGESGKSWPISSADFRLTQLDLDTCVGAFFTVSGHPSWPHWIIGDTFLKNVYAVFRAKPPSVGFAQLSDFALSMNRADLPLPTPSVGVPQTTITATSGSARTITEAISPHIISDMCMILVTATLLYGWIS